MESFLAGIDWEQPWFAPWRADGWSVAAQVVRGAALHQALNRQGSAPVQFVPQAALPARTPYESFIFETRQCPVREGLHDFFNGLCWRQLPLAKAQLNALQAAAIAAAAPGSPRGRLRDAITLFDENGALLDAPPPLWEALRARDWQRLFVGLRPLWQEARLLVFGHALLEKLVTPRKALTAHVWGAPCPLHDAGEVDTWLAHQLSAERLAAKPFTPLPVLGIPGWCPDNENFSFYDDSVVFRESHGCRSFPARQEDPTAQRS